MNTNLSTSYAAFQLEHELRVAIADHACLAEQAAAPGSRRLAATVMRQWAGALLVRAGQRVQGTPGAAQPQPA